MEYDKYVPDVVDFAFQIISMHEENEQLRHEVEHYKEMHKIHCKSIDDSDKSGKEMIGLMISAVLDPDSVINKGHAAIIKEQVTG